MKESQLTKDLRAALPSEGWTCDRCGGPITWAIQEITPLECFYPSAYIPGQVTLRVRVDHESGGFPRTVPFLLNLTMITVDGAVSRITGIAHDKGFFPL